MYAYTSSNSLLRDLGQLKFKIRYKTMEKFTKCVIIAKLLSISDFGINCVLCVASGIRNMSQPIVDLVVAVVSVPLLVMFALLLQTQLQMSNNTGNHNRHYTNLREALFKPPPLKITTALPDIEPTTLRQEVDTWTRDTHARWTVLGLGLALLIVSLAVCIYVGQRLGICIRRKNDGCEMEEGGRDEDGYQSGSLMDDFIRREFLYSQGSSGTMRSLNSSLQLCLEQPPSYEAVVCYDLPPPPYCALTMSPGNDKIPGVHKNQQEAD